MDFLMKESKNIIQTIIFFNHANIKLYQNNVGNFFLKDMGEFLLQDTIYLM